MLETKLYADNSFVTLTYEDEHMPRLPDGRGMLVPSEMQNWLKRLRKAYSSATAGRTLRFYGVGEYGDNSWRPHYHLALFNFPNCHYGHSRYSTVVKSCCVVCDMVRDTWDRGHVLVAELNTNSAQYVAGYVTKKMTHPDDPRLDGLPPEFARMSLRPGIGADAVPHIADTMRDFNLEGLEGDVPSSLRHGRRLLPLGRYLQRKLRKELGREENAPLSVLKKIEADLQPLREYSFENSLSLKEQIIKAADQSVLNMEARQAIFKSRKDKL